MRTETTVKNIYTFDELSDDQKQAVFENWRTEYQDDFWSENIIYDATEIATLMGIDIDKIYFSGFSCQGDGACFTGNYAYKKGSVKAVKNYYASVDTRLHEIVQTLCDLQKPHFYRLTCSIKHSGHYYHEFCTQIDTYVGEDTTPYVLGSINEVLRDFMRWIYKQLETEYEYTQSDEYITDTIEANEYEFYADGSIA